MCPKSLKLLKSYFPCKVFLLLSFILLSYTYSYSQEHVEVYASASDMEKDNVTEAIIPNNVSLQLFGFLPTSNYDGIGNGGGLAVGYKHNFHKYVGLGTNVGYTYTTKEDSTYIYNDVEYYYKNKGHFIDASLFVSIQRETALGEVGFVPWFLVGVSLDLGVLKSAGGNIDFLGVGAGFLVGLGIKYNFDKIYIGGGMNYQYTFLEGWQDMDTYGPNIDPSGLRIFAEVGLRM